MAKVKPLVTKLGGIERLQVGDLLELGKLNIGAAGSLTIVSNAITITRSYHRLTATGTGTTAQLHTVSGGEEGDILVLRPNAGSPTISVRNSAGNLFLSSAGHFSMNDASDLIGLLHNGLGWLELFRSNNG